MTKEELRDDILVVQLTGRMHFGAARGIERCGRLAALITDFYLPNTLKPLGCFSGVLRAYDVLLPSRKVRGNPLIGLIYRYKLRRYGPFRTETHVEASVSLAKQARSLLRRLPISTVYSFDTQALETFQFCADKPLRLVLEQCVAPRRSQMEVLERLGPLISANEYEERQAQLTLLAKREREEWALADRIVCPSNYVREELSRWGVPEEKIVVVPYGFSRPDSVNHVAFEPEAKSLPRAMFAGTVEPRKGLQDVVAALHQLDDSALALDVYGSLSRASPDDYSAPGVVLHGKVSFEAMRQAYAASDIFVLTSYLEGSATVVYEAMSYGLPCIVTPETGSVVRDGVDGFVVPSGDVERIADCLGTLARNPDLRAKMGRSAALRALEFSFSKYGERLCTALQNF